MSSFGLPPEAPRGADYAIAWLVGVLLAGLTYLVCFIIALAVIFRVLYDPLTDPADDVMSAGVVLFSICALLAGLVGSWVAARLVRRKRADARSAWVLVAGVAAVGGILLLLGLWASPGAMAAQVVALVVGAVGGGFLGLRRGRA